MPRRPKYAPKHRNLSPVPAYRRSLRRSMTYSGVALAATGLAVTGGVVTAAEDQPADPAAQIIAAAQAENADTVKTAELMAERTRDASRSQGRAPIDQQEQRNRSTPPAQQDPRDIARKLMPDYGFSAAEFDCLDALWVSESDWDPHADNPTSSAYGIPQALTGGTHDNLPADYMTNPVSQIEWGLWYIDESYGGPCAAWEFKQANNWY